MFPVTTQFVSAIASGHAAIIVCDAWRNGSLLASDLPVLGGSVTIDTTSDVRRQLSINLGAEPGLWDTLAPVGTELRPSRGVRYPNGTREMCPLGVFPIDVQTAGYSADQRTLTITAPDKWAKVQRARFLTPKASTRGMTIRTQIANLITEAIPGQPVTVTATATDTMGSVIWERERADTIRALADSIGAEVFMDASGTAIIRDLPDSPTPPALWTIAPGVNGLFAEGSRSRDRQRTYSIVVVQSEVADGTSKLAPVIVRDNTPASPTYYLGSFGSVPYFMTSELFRSSAQMLRAGTARLRQVTSLESQFSVSAGTVNPALEGNDTIAVVFPPDSPGLVRPAELQLIGAVTVPLSVSDAQPITLRSTGPTTIDSA